MKARRGRTLSAINPNNNSPLTFPPRLSSALFLHFNQHVRLSSDSFSGALAFDAEAQRPCAASLIRSKCTHLSANHWMVFYEGAGMWGAAL